jgi:hypothetical protein
MAVSSQPVFVSASAPSASVLGGVRSDERVYIEDEEFASDLACSYDRMLQPSAWRVWPRILLVAASAAVFLVAVSLYIR